MQKINNKITPELYKTLIAIVDERIKELHIPREDFHDMKEMVKRLAQAQARTEEAVERLAQAQARTERSVANLAKEIGGLSATIGFGLEDICRVVLPGYLERHYNIYVTELNRKFFRINKTDVEINFYGEGRKNGKKVIILGEAKSRIYKLLRAINSPLFTRESFYSLGREASASLFLMSNVET